MQFESAYSVATPEDLLQAKQTLQRGGIVAFPTETYYGLAADPFNGRALSALYRVKQRDPALPILVLVRNRDELLQLTPSIPEGYETLINRFWPGPLTLVFPARPHLPDILLGGTGTIAVRISPHPVALALCHSFQGPITATSANLSGLPPAESANQVRTVFADKVDFVLDGGKTPGQKPSTIVAIQDKICRVLREGQISAAQIFTCLSEK